VRGGRSRQVSPALTVVEEAKVSTFADSDKVVVVLYVAEASGAVFTAYSDLAKSLRDSYTFGYVVDADGSTAQAEGTSTPGVVLYKKFDERKAVYTGAVEAQALTEFIKANSVPLMDDIGPENYQGYAESGKPLAYLFVGSDADRAAHGPAAEELAKEYKGQINFVYLDATKYGGHANNVNLKQQWPAFAIQRQSDGAKFPLDQSKPLTAAALRAFVKDFADGKLQPSLKSEEIPASQDEPVHVLVGKQFAEVVNQPKDVFVEFYAPWCGHCKNLAPIWDQLGAKAPKTDFVIAKMDATANDIPSEFGIQIQGFPTLKLFRADGRVVDYEGDRSLPDLVRFLQKNAVNGKKVTDEDGDGDDDGKDEL
jgi:protein disulfide-isomerase A1